MDRIFSTSRAPLRVVVGEAQPIYRAGLVHLLGRAGFDVIATTGDARELVRQVRAHGPDVAVVDLRLPPDLDEDGLAAAQELRRMTPAVAVLALSPFAEERYPLALLGDRPNGVGYLLKDRLVDADELADSARRVASGESVVDPEVVRRIAARPSRRQPTDELTVREREVLVLLARGRSNRGIAELLQITVSGVEHHVTSIFVKLRLGSSELDHRRVLAALRYLGR